MSIFDWTASLLGVWLVGLWLGIRTQKGWVLWVLGWTAAGVAIHAAVGVPTELGHKLGVSGPPVRATCR